MRIIDLSFEIESNIPTCGTPWHRQVKIEPMGTIEKVGRNTHSIIMGSHSGTHIDAPFHFIASGDTVEKLDVDVLWGEGKVIDFRWKKRGDIVTLQDVESIRVESRLLFCFGWYHHWKTGTYYQNYPFFSEEAIESLVERGMRLMGMDTPSPDDGRAILTSSESDSPNHRFLLERGVVILEYLNNTDALAADSRYEIVALPLKIHGSDGSPARVLVKEID